LPSAGMTFIPLLTTGGALTDTDNGESRGLIIGDADGVSCIEVDTGVAAFIRGEGAACAFMTGVNALPMPLSPTAPPPVPCQGWNPCDGREEGEA